MRQTNRKALVLFIWLPLFLLSRCKDNYSKIILGVWRVQRLEFLTPLPDSSEMRSEANQATIHFIDKKNFVSTRIVKGEKETRKGFYRIEGNELIHGKERGEIVLLNNSQLSLRFDSRIVAHFSKVIVVQ